MTPDLFRHLVAQAALAPSVHNVQPARWRLDGDAIWLVEDQGVRLPAADPTGHDAAMSLGAAAEGMALAAAQDGLRTNVTMAPDTTNTTGLRPVCRLTFEPGGAPDPLAALVGARQSWRAVFAPASNRDREAAPALASDDCAVIAAPDAIETVARLLDKASYGFMARDDFRAELLSWMRLRRSHPAWARDGLNAETMGLGPLERLAAGIVMGPAFRPLHALRLAAPLLAEVATTRSAAAIVAFHRPVGEDPFDNGRAFYRTWLRIEAAGFGAAVLAALADDATSAQAVADMAGIGADRRLVSAFRIGRRPRHAPVDRARLRPDDLIV